MQQIVGDKRGSTEGQIQLKSMSKPTRSKIIPQTC